MRSRAGALERDGIEVSPGGWVFQWRDWCDSGSGLCYSFAAVNRAFSGRFYSFK